MTRAIRLSVQPDDERPVRSSAYTWAMSATAEGIRVMAPDGTVYDLLQAAGAAEKGDKGDPGDPGPKGDTGDAGPAGPPGDAGAAGPAGEAGPAGPKGDPGDPGAVGPAGDPGAAGAEGATGPAGAPGGVGPAGEPGATGQRGPAGADGTQGLQGPKGDQGDPGSPGVKGDTGLQGIQGIQGIQGAKGDTGATGTAGTGAPVWADLGAATALALGTNTAVKVTPSATGTLTSTVPAAGSERVVILLQSSTTAKTMTFGTGFKPSTTLALGTTASRVFVVRFVSDGTNLYEASRTAAIVA